MSKAWNNAIWTCWNKLEKDALHRFHSTLSFVRAVWKIYCFPVFQKKLSGNVLCLNPMKKQGIGPKRMNCTFNGFLDVALSVSPLPPKKKPKTTTNVRMYLVFSLVGVFCRNKFCTEFYPFIKFIPHLWANEVGKCLPSMLPIQLAAGCCVKWAFHQLKLYLYFGNQ